MDEDIRDFFQSMADELRASPATPSDILLRRVRRRRLRTMAVAFLGVAILAGGALGGIRAFGGVHRSTPAQKGCSQGWTEPHNPAASLNGYLGAIAGTSPEDLWAVGSVIGHPSYPLIEHWDGDRWSPVSSPRLPGAGLASVAVVSGTDVWAVGDDYGGKSSRTLVEHWDGAKWSVVPSPNLVSPTWKDNWLSAVAASSASDVWAVGTTTAGGGQESRPLIEHWNGTAWTLSPVPDGGSAPISLSGVDVVAPDDVWAVGQRAVGQARFGFTQFPLVMHWDGSAWTVASTPEADGHSGGLSGVDGLSAKDVWAVGSAFDQSRDRVIPIILHWDGSSWTLVTDLPSDLPYGLEAIDAVGPNDVWAADKGVSYAYALHWDGRTWSLIAPPSGPIKGGRLSGIVAFPSGEAVAVGSSSVESGMKPLAIQLCAPGTSRPSG